MYVLKMIRQFTLILGKIQQWQKLFHTTLMVFERL
jgi:hypothetical protein